jgi:hypothetical protein
MKKISKKEIAQASVVLERLDGLRLSRKMKAAVENFERIHRAYIDGAARITVLRAKIEDLLAEVHSSDAALDGSVLRLADVLVASGLGSRGNPFASFTNHSPAVLTRLGYAREVHEVRALAAKLLRTHPPRAVASAIRNCSSRADDVEKALACLSQPRARLAHYVALLQPHVTAWRAGFQRLKTEAAAWWIDDRHLFRAVFAPPERVQIPIRRKRSRKPRARETAVPAGLTAPPL